MLLINDLKRQTASIRQELDSALARVLDRGYYILGPETEAFEQEFSTYCSRKYCVAVGNGTEALELALLALEIGAGDKVLTVANAGGYSTTAILAVGAEPVYVDVSPNSMNMNPACLRGSDLAGAKAVIITHLYGRLAEIEELAGIARRNGLKVIEDCAQAHGAVLKDHQASNFGEICCFSFYPTKNLGALGDAGALVLDDDLLAGKLVELRQYGWVKKYNYSIAHGINSRMDEFQAAVLRLKLTRLSLWNKQRRKIAQVYNECLAEVTGVDIPDGFGLDNSAHLYVLRCRDRQKLADGLQKFGISTAVHYPLPDYKQLAFQGRFCQAASLPVTDQLCSEVLTLPCFPEMEELEVKQVCSSVKQCLEQA